MGTVQFVSDPTTDLGGSGHAFPRTRWSAIRDATDPGSPTRRRSLEQIVTVYWRPVYAYLRRKWGRSNEDAKDLTQEFFLTLCEQDFLGRLSPERGRFRAYLMTALDNFTRLRHRYETRQKRGGGVPHFSLDIRNGFEPPFGASPEQLFIREWARALLQEALSELEVSFRSEGRELEFQVFAAYDLDPSSHERKSYHDLAAQFGISLVDVKNILYRTRVRLRERVLNRVRDTVTTDEEAVQEMKELFGGPES